MQSSAVHQTSGAPGSFLELSAFLKEQREEAKADRAEMESKIEQQRLESKTEKAELRKEMEAQMQKMDAETKVKMQKMREELTPRPAVTEEQLATLQSRLEAMHAAQLLADEELFALEDICVDYIALGLVTAEMAGGNAAASKLLRLVRVSEGVAADASFARQAKRRFV